MQHWKIVNFDTGRAIQPGFKFEDIWHQDHFQLQIGQKDASAYWVLNRSNLDKFLDNFWIKRFESRFHEIEYCYVFYKAKNFVSGNLCHIDIEPNSDEKVLYALNWCHGIDDAYMIWYDYFTMYPEIVEQLNSKYVQVEKNNLLEIDRKVIGSNLTLINTAVPHIVQSGTTDRWSISLRLKKIESIKTWNNAMYYFA